MLTEQEIWNREWKNFSQSWFLKINPGIIREIKQLFLEKLKDKKILEVGSGSGSDLVVLAKLGAKCTSLDYASEALKVCRKLARENKVKIKTVLADCRKLPFKDNSFDLVFSVGLMEHFLDVIPVLQEQLRIVKRGGYLLVDVPQKYNPYTIVKHLRIFLGKYILTWEKEYSVADLKSFGKKLNAKLVRCYGRDSAFTVKFPINWQPRWQKMIRPIEKSQLGPYICLNVGGIYEKI